MMAREQAAALLDEMIFTRVMGNVDFNGLHQLQLELWLMVEENGLGGSEQECRGIANAMIERALRRFAERASYYVDHTLGDCARCQLERVKAVRAS